MFKATFHPPHPEYGMIFTGKKILGISQISLAEVSCSCKQFLRRVKGCKWLCCESMPLRYKRRYCQRIISLLFPCFFSIPPKQMLSLTIILTIFWIPTCSTNTSKSKLERFVMAEPTPELNTSHIHPSALCAGESAPNQGKIALLGMLQVPHWA